ncbi:ATP-binding protein [Brevundimonas aurantiaca]|uniref:ATP-binding protein n=1 Tax=Brevundimonas aurantiaca TaxID=74316 RepID=UPI001D182DCD|nr:ATP-binding protein [Brevundimonas aurantiaca]MCC4293468.1 HAMP domain-containing protein [Brevundimonas aurantiaca]
MPLTDGIGRNVAARIGLVTLTGFILSAFCAFFVYAWVFENDPGAVAAPHHWKPQAVDYAVIAALILTAIGLAVLAGALLARQIILPLASLAITAQRISEGDLTARATVGKRALRETAQLVEDFNRMAQRLQTHAEERIAWNAKIAHELRTPVTILKGRLEGVADGVFQIDDHTLTSLRRQIEGLARIVEDLRVVSLAESNHLDLQLEAVDLSTEIGALREIVQPGLSAAGFETQWRLEPALAVCDPTRLRQAALALVENARRHAVPGPLVIRTATFGAFARISIEDSGPGIDADRAAHIFHPFKRDMTSVTGSGLGLAVVRAIAEAHGGLALHRNTVAGGSLFTLEIPRRPAPRPAV